MSIPYKKVFFAMSGLMLIIMVVLVPQMGVVGDEEIDATNGRAALAYYTEGDTTFANYKTATKEWLDTMTLVKEYGISTHQKYYGTGFEILPAIAEKYLGVQRYVFEVRHLLCAIFGWLMMLFCGLIGRELKNWQTGCIALVIIFFTPVVFGSSFIASKDIPPAAGFAIAVFAMLRIYRQTPRFGIANWAMLAAGIALAVSVRINGLMLPFYFAVAAVLLFVCSRRFRTLILGNRVFAFKFVGAALLICILGTLAGLCFYPNFFYDGPVKHIKDTFGVMSKFKASRILMFWEGQEISSLNLPPNYLIKSYLYTIPLWVFAGAGLFMLNLRRIRKTYSAFAFVFLAFTVVFPVCYLILTKANIYNGWRHSTFVYSSFVPLAAIGFYETAHWFKKNRVWRVAFAIAVVLCILPTALWTARNYKYAPAYYNVLAGNPYNRFDMEYSGTSLVNCAKWLIKNKLTDTTRQYTIASKGWNVVAWAKTKQYRNINVIYAPMRAFASTNCDYAIMDIVFIPPKVVKKFFPPKGTVYVERIDGNPICAVVEKNPLDAEGIRLIRDSHFAEGIEKLKQAYDYNPNNFGLWHWMGLGYYHLGQFDEAIKFFNQDINFWPVNEQHIYGIAYIGAALVSQKKYDQGITNLRQLLQIDRKDPYLLAFVNTQLGIAYYYKKDYAEAASHFEKGIDYYPQNAQVLQYCRSMAQQK